MSATFAVVVGSIVGHLYNKRAASGPTPERSERLGVLIASGLIVGESLFGVLIAGLIVAFSTDAPLALVSGDFALAKILGVVSFVGLIFALYSWMLRQQKS